MTKYDWTSHFAYVQCTSLSLEPGRFVSQACIGPKAHNVKHCIDFGVANIFELHQHLGTSIGMGHVCMGDGERGGD